MLRKILLSATIAVLATLLQAAQAHAYGGYHAGYTHVGPTGVHHAGYTTAGGAGGYHAGYTHTGGGGAYHAGYTQTGGGGAYHAGYTQTGGGGAYHAGYHYSPSSSGTAYGGVRVGGAYGYVR
jgi:hypothetical protein